MKIMIVEDEPLLREGLIRKIDWQSLGLQLVAEAGDGFEALSLLAASRPDVVLTDVRMPAMDGLQFIQQARLYGMPLKFVIISGFNEFEYVREALQHNVKDYLLKPIDKGKLNALLGALRKEWEAERLEAEALSRLREVGALIKESSLQPRDFQLTHQLADQDAGWSGLPARFLACRYFAAASARIVALDETSRFAPEEMPLARFAAENVLTHALTELEDTETVLFKHAYRREELVLLLAGTSGSFHAQAAATLKRSANWLAQRLGLSVAVGVSEAKTEISRLSAAGAESRKAMQNRLFLGLHAAAMPFAAQDEGTGAEAGMVPGTEARIVPGIGASMVPGMGARMVPGTGQESTSGMADDILPDAAPNMAPGAASHSLDEAERALNAMLDEGAHREFLDYTGGMFRALAASEDARYEQAEFMFAEIMHILRKHAAKKGVALAAWPSTEAAEGLERLSDWRDILLIVDRQLQRIAVAPERGSERSGDDIVAAVKRHIEERYAEELSLQWVADHYHIHPNYFSKRFKRVVGASFGDYLTQTRMNRAQVLLRTTTLKIARIAQLVGYEDQNYFCNVFKRTTGISPSAFRG